MYFELVSRVFLFYNLYVNKIKTSVIIFFIFVLFSLIYLTLNYSPSQIGPMGILLFFIFLYINSVGLISLAIVLLMSIFNFIYLNIFKKTSKLFNTSRYIYYYSTLFATIPVFIIAFKSVGEVSLFEIFLIFVFQSLGIFYIRKKILP